MTGFCEGAGISCGAVPDRSGALRFEGFEAFGITFRGSLEGGAGIGGAGIQRSSSLSATWGTASTRTL